MNSGHGEGFSCQEGETAIEVLELRGMLCRASSWEIVPPEGTFVRNAQTQLECTSSVTSGVA